MGYQELLFKKLKENGYDLRLAPVEKVQELKEEIMTRVERGDIDRALYEKHMSWFNFSPEEKMTDAKSVIIASIPQSAISVGLHWKGQIGRFLVPPTYSYKPADGNLIGLIESVLSPAGFSVVRAPIPEKLLAARTGLAKYGRNNITYIESIGSYHRLVALYTDMPCEDYHWGEPQMLEDCEHCLECIKSCPTASITQERFLVKAERCLTYFNESRNPFPSWVDSKWHNAVIGCFKCQTSCPANPKLPVEKSSIIFSEEEVRQIIDSIPKDQLGEETRDKLDRLCLLVCYHFIGRNLSVLLS